MAVSSRTDGTSLYANGAFCTLLGVDHSKFTSHPTLDFCWDPAERPRLLAQAEAPNGLGSFTSPCRSQAFGLQVNWLTCPRCLTCRSGWR